MNYLKKKQEISNGTGKAVDFFAILVWYLLWFKMFPCEDSKIVICLKATNNTNGKQVLKPTEFELNRLACTHTHSYLAQTPLDRRLQYI